MFVEDGADLIGGKREDDNRCCWRSPMEIAERVEMSGFDLHDILCFARQM